MEPINKAVPDQAMTGYNQRKGLSGYGFNHYFGFLRIRYLYWAVGGDVHVLRWTHVAAP